MTALAPAIDRPAGRASIRDLYRSMATCACAALFSFHCQKTTSEVGVTVVRLDVRHVQQFEDVFLSFGWEPHCAHLMLAGLAPRLFDTNDLEKSVVRERIATDPGKFSQ